MAKKKSTAPAGADLDQDERLEMAASFIERAMSNIVVCVAALGSKNGPDSHLVIEGVMRTLDEGVWCDLDIASEIFKTWKAAEVRHD
jgi:hypothetical protein